MPKEKTKWGKETTLDRAYELGFHLGMRKTLKVLAEEGDISEDTIAWLLEEKYEKDILKDM